MSEVEVYNDFDKIESVLNNSKYDIDDYKRLLNKMGDEKSKLMLYYRIMFDNTNDAYYMLMLEKVMYYQSSFFSSVDKMMFDYIEFLLKNKNYNKTIYVLGFPCEDKQLSMWHIMTFFLHKRDGLNIACIFDENNEDEYYFECDHLIKTIPLNEFNKFDFEEDAIFIISNPNLQYMYDLLINEMQVSSDNIFIFNKTPICQRNIQYFCEPFIKFDNNEILVDGGASDFQTTLNYCDYVNCLYKKIYVIEPIKDDYDKCVNMCQEYNLGNIHIENVGLWKEDTSLGFCFKDYGSSFIDSNNNNSINVRSIDNILAGEGASIIKLDIEGSEYEALEGAINTITNYNPLLMVCIYHKPNDALSLANLVLSMNSDYSIFIRHYAFSIYETVMYFVPKNKINKIYV